jgi:hypothetical protein
MGKYDSLKFLKKTKARVEHKCRKCGHLINIGEFYYVEELKDRFLHSLHRKKFCSDCYEKYGEKLKL